MRRPRMQSLGNTTAALNNSGGRRRAQEVLDAAATVFATKGFRAASTEDIADALGIKQGSLYYYFESKDAALEQVCTAGGQQILERVEAAEAGSRSCRDALERLLLCHFESMRLQPAYLRVFLHERRHVRGTARRRVIGFATRIESVMQKVLERGVRSGEFRPDLQPKIAMVLILGMVATASAWYDKEHAATLEVLCNQVKGFVLAGASAATPPRSSQPQFER